MKKTELRKIIREEIQSFLTEENSKSGPFRVGDTFKVDNPKTGIWEITISDMYYFLGDVSFDLSIKHIDTGKEVDAKNQSLKRFEDVFVKHLIEEQVREVLSESRFVSNINEKWTDIAKIHNDLINFLIDYVDAAGEDDLDTVISVINRAIMKAKKEIDRV